MWSLIPEIQIINISWTEQIITLLDKVTRKQILTGVVPKTNSCKQLWMHSLTTLQLPLSTAAIWMSNSEYPMDLLWFKLWMKWLKFNKWSHNKEELIATQNTAFSTPLIQSDLREIQDIYNKITRVNDLKVKWSYKLTENGKKEKICLKRWRCQF